MLSLLGSNGHMLSSTPFEDEFTPLNAPAPYVSRQSSDLSMPLIKRQDTFGDEFYDNWERSVNVVVETTPLDLDEVGTILEVDRSSQESNQNGESCSEDGLADRTKDDTVGVVTGQVQQQRGQQNRMSHDSKIEKKKNHGKKRFRYHEAVEATLAPSRDTKKSKKQDLTSVENSKHSVAPQDSDAPARKSSAAPPRTKKASK
jgi:hypothetical protein